MNAAVIQRLTQKEKLTGLLRFHLRAFGIAAPALREEYRFHPVRLFRFDFALPHLKIAIEVEGGVFGRAKSRHTTGSGYTRDCVKYNLAAAEGWRVLRFTGPLVTSGEAVRTAVDVIKALEHARAEQEKGA